MTLSANMKTLLEMFPRASKSMIKANPHLSPSTVNKMPSPEKTKRGAMNKTESEFALILEAQKRAGEILRYEYEGITLRWADMRYTPDFVVFEDDPIKTGESTWDVRHRTRIKLIEIKGGHIWDRDIVRFKGARAYWPEFAFEMYQKTRNGWKRKL